MLVPAPGISDHILINATAIVIRLVGVLDIGDIIKRVRITATSDTTNQSRFTLVATSVGQQIGTVIPNGLPLIGRSTTVEDGIPTATLNIPIQSTTILELYPGITIQSGTQAIIWRIEKDGGANNIFCTCAVEVARHVPDPLVAKS